MTFPKETPVANKSQTSKAASPSRRRTQVKPKTDLVTAIAKASVGPEPSAVGPRPGSKTAKVLALLKRPQGASLKGC